MRVALAAASLALVLAAPAAAHVGVKSHSPVGFPDGFHFLSYQKVPGWKARVFKEKLDQPVDLGGFSVDEQSTRIVWRARRPKRDRIAPGQFQDFPLSVRVPDGDAGSDTPAPHVTLLAPEEE